MVMIPPTEKKPLKRPRLGPPDIYPQEPKQKEDELTPINVKQGFTPATQIPDEHGSARNSNITASKALAFCFLTYVSPELLQAANPFQWDPIGVFGQYISSILSKKQELSTFQDSNQLGRKKQQINPKDHFWPVTARSQHSIEAWFKDLAGSKPLTYLAKKVPIFNKKEEIFVTLLKYGVPTCRAAWFIKMCSAYTVAISEAKLKKRQLTDPSIDWTLTLCKFLKEQFQKLADYYHTSHNPSISSMTVTVDIENTYNLWNYCNQLARYMFEEGLLDKHEYLMWMLELMEKSKSSDDGILKLILPIILQYVDDFVYSESLSRRLAYYCCKKLNQLCTEMMADNPSTRSQSPTLNSLPNSGVQNIQNLNNCAVRNPVLTAFMEYASCEHHRQLILSLSVIIQVITLECPTGLVWNNIAEAKPNSSLNGSPLDLLPAAPSCLPMPSSADNSLVRNDLKIREQEIRQRGRAAEIRWSSDKWQQNTIGATMGRILQTLENLDKHIFEKVDSSNSLDFLYNKIFSSKESYTDINNDMCLIQVLCQWAVTTQRSGEHRSLVVGKLLEKRQNEILAERYPAEDGSEEKESISEMAMSSAVPVYHYLLMNFLDNDAPILTEDNDSADSKKSFANLVLLFSELIRCNVFSHDTYMCTLISRGCLPNVTASVVQQPATPGLPSSIKSSALTPDVPNIGHLAPNDQKQNMSNAMQMSMVPPQMVAMNQHHEHNGKNEFPLPESRGMFGLMDPSKTGGKHEVESSSHNCGTDVMDTLDDSKIDDDLGEILQHIKEGQQNMIEPLDSVGSDKELTAHTPLSHHPSTDNIPHSSGTQINSTVVSLPSRHLQYTTHFPLPQDESSFHDCNQRHILLYGVGKARDEAVKGVKKVTKEIMKLFGKKSSIDSSKSTLEGLKIKKYSHDYFESLLSRFKNLSYFDQHAVTSTCAATVIDMLQSFSSNSSNYLPAVEYISFLFDLMEIALNISGLFDFAIQLIKELPEVDVALASKSSVLMSVYSQSLALYCVGVLRRYHSSLLVCQEQTTSAFDGLCKLVKNVNNPTDCSSAERCILVHLYDLYTSCNFIRQSKHSEPFNVAYPKVKQSLYSSIQPSALNLLWNTTFMIDYINNPKKKVGKDLIRQLNENPGHRYSFLCNAIVNICNAQDSDKLNDISVLCAELTASCPSLSSEWLGVLKALCCSSNHGCGFIDVLTQVDVGDLSIHDSLTVFTAILISRHCFSLQDFVVHIALLSLIAACPSAGGGDQDSEPGARLTCHILLRLFKTIDAPTLPSTTPSQPAPLSQGHSSGSTNASNMPAPYSPCPLPGPPSLPGPIQPNSNQKLQCSVKLSCDRHLLTAAHNSITVGAVLAVLKAILVLGDTTNTDAETKSKAEQNSEKSAELSISDILGTIDDSDSDLMSLSNVDAKGGNNSNGMESKGLSEFAKHALLQICNQDWIYERCLKDPDILCTQEMLLDPMLSNRQAQQLLQLICHPGCSLNSEVRSDDSSTLTSECKQHVIRILQNLDQWTLRVSWLELLLMYKQSQASNELNAWSDSLARATIDIFQLTSEELSSSKSNSKNNSKNSNSGVANVQLYVVKAKKNSHNIWLVAPLISKLPSAVQGRVLKAAAQVLESGNWSTKSKDKDKNVQRSTSLLGQQPFLSLVLTCLKGQDEQREGLLNSLQSQLLQYFHPSRDEKTFIPDDPKGRQAMQDALQLRLSLVGGMFDTIQRSSTITTDWAVLLVQLASHGVIDTQNNSELFTTILDMLAVLVHTNIIQSEMTGGEKGEQENKKHNLNIIIKKIKKELLDKNSDAITMIRQLLPIPKYQCEVIACEAMGSLGLQVAEKQMVSPWDLLEGHKNPAPLCWSWFGASKMERKPLKYEEAHRLLLYHTHSMKRPLSYYLESPHLPMEDLEPAPTPVVIDKTQPHPALMQDMGVKKPPPPGLSPMDHSPRGMGPIIIPPEIGTGRGRKPKQQRRKRTNRGGMASAGQTRGKTTSPVRHMYDPNMYGSGPPVVPPGPQNWYGQQPPIQQQQQSQQPYYSQQPLPPGGGPRYGAPLSQSKAALSNMLRQRHPASVSGQYMPGGENPPAPYQNMEMMKQRQMMMRAQHTQGIQNNQTSMYPVQAMQTPQSTPLHHLPPQQQNIPPGFSGYGGNPSNIQQSAPSMIDGQQSNIPAYNQSYHTTNSNMMTGGGLAAPVPQPQPQQQYMSQAMNQRSIPQPPQQNTRAHYQMSQGAMQTAQNVNINTQHQQQQINQGQYSGHMQQIQQSQVQQNQPGQQQQIQRPGQPGQPNQQMQHLRQQQHQQQHIMQQMQQKQQQQQTAALVAQLRGQLSSGGNSNQPNQPPPSQQTQQPPQQQAQHNRYHQAPNY
ncbi:Mediator of RNA polymerase II transcription subunit 12-like protein [Nymphon striatum]|nr:Mediator of RNA polymerase II transcription subunit 12-like protein [Nymphon striatum]